MEDHQKLSDASVAAGGGEIALSESTNATIEMMQEPEIAVEAGMTGDDMVDQLGAVLNKYEVPMGLMNKLMMLSEYDVLEFLIDDSGSMTLNSDTTDKITGKPQTRWQECHKYVWMCLNLFFFCLCDSFFYCCFVVLLFFEGAAVPTYLYCCSTRVSVDTFTNSIFYLQTIEGNDRNSSLRSLSANWNFVLESHHILVVDTQWPNPRCLFGRCQCAN